MELASKVQQFPVQPMQLFPELSSSDIRSIKTLRRIAGDMVMELRGISFLSQQDPRFSHYSM